MSRFLLPLAAFFILIPIFIVGLTKDPRQLPSPFIDELAPSFTLPSLTDPEKTVSSGDYAGQYALVNVWATWCVGCRQEHEFLMELSRSQSVPIYGINWRDGRSEALRWLQALGDPYVASGFDEDGRVGIDWGVYGAPETFLVSADGIVLHKHLGPLDATAWERDFVPKIGGGS
ncbi:MAG: DsbE family thiol:disulfide interchange protein [Woeseiaceae bacterium]|nr:DsbE family thiol:disulfide interchange protein [Woeseiaceae bacterium]